MSVFDPVIKPLVEGLSDPASANTLVDPAADARNQYDGMIGKGSGDAGWFAGTTVDGVVAVWNGIASRDWVAVGINAGGTGVELLGAAMDPVGWAATQLSGWLLEHLMPFRAVLHGLAGSPELIKGYAQTWDNISREMRSTAVAHRENSVRDTNQWHGRAADGYRERAAALADVCENASVVARSLGTASLMMAEVISGARSAVRDITANAVGAAVSVAVEEAVTGGLATPVVVVQFLKRLIELGKKVAAIVRSVGKTINDLSSLLATLKNMSEALYKQGNVAGSR